MDLITSQSILAEQLVIVDLLRNKVEVYPQLGGKCTHDMVIAISGKLFSVQIKSTEYRPRGSSYQALLRSIRSNKTVNTIKLFDNSKVDILSVVIPSRNCIMYFWAKNITTKSVLTIREEELDSYSFERLLRDYTQDILNKDDDIVQTTTLNVASES